MARGKKPSVSPSERRKWLEQLDAGMGITEIARASGRDIRIVKRHIVLALEETTVARVRHDFLLGRLQMHQEDLLTEVGRLKSLINQPLLLPIKPDGEKLKIYDALKEHLKKLPLIGLIETYEGIVLKGKNLRGKLINEIKPSEADIKETLLQETISFPWTKDIVDDLISGFVPDQSTSSYFKKKLSDGAYEVVYKARNLVRSTIPREEADRVIEAHQKLVSLVYSQEAIFEEYRETRMEIGETIIDQLDEFKIKRLVPGHCRYCPI